jgi:5'-phosphate synthase pdxT subunit
MKIAVLAVQGAFIEHEQVLSSLGAECFEIRQKRDINTPPDGIILPGGESTVMGKLIAELGIKEKLIEYIKEGVSVFGTCAGMILLSKNIEGGENPILI